LRGENILELVGQLAERVKAASSGIAFESVYCAAYAADDFLVGRTCLEFKARFVEHLYEIASALKKERAKFSAAVLGRTFHPVTSTR
jgi:hypothetical protein